jgi:hypothetical protein
MTYDDAVECDEVTVEEAIAECRKHGIEAWRFGDLIITDGTNNRDVVCVIDSYGCVQGGELLAFLGY